MDQYKIKLALDCAPLEICITAQLWASNGDEAVQAVLNTVYNQPEPYTTITSKSWNLIACPLGKSTSQV